jgi:hypothetical protein
MPASDSYTAVPLDDSNEKALESYHQSSSGSNVIITFGIGVLLFGFFILGVGIGTLPQAKSSPMTAKKQNSIPYPQRTNYTV